MATSRLFGYMINNASPEPAQFTKNGNLLAADVTTPSTPTGYIPNEHAYYMGPDEEVHPDYIAYTMVNAEDVFVQFNTEGDQGDDGTPGDKGAWIAFRKFDGTDADFLIKVNEIQALRGDDPSATAGDAYTWVNLNSCWTTNDAPAAEPATTRPPNAYKYWNIRSCQNPEVTGVLRTPSSEILIQEQAYDFNQVLIEAGNEEWDGTSVYIVNGSTELINFFAHDESPKTAVCDF
jgi:hypothetical protein